MSRNTKSSILKDDICGVASVVVVVVDGSRGDVEDYS